VKFTPTELPEVILVEPDVFPDSRGFFLETYHARKYRAGGILPDFVQDNQSRSGRDTLRGLHSQVAKAQGKLVRVLEGEVFDVAVDVRRGSPRFARWVGVRLSADNFRQLYIPPGFLHGFCVVSETASVAYKCTDLYDAADEIGVIWNDPVLAIRWPSDKPGLSKKDAAYPTLRDIEGKLPVYRN